jgi:3-oxoacyl-[acyl-carrier-protein] synthase I
MSGVAVEIIGLGASTAIGRTVWSSAAAARAGVAGFSEHPFLIDTAGEPVRVARASWLGADVRGSERYARLLLPAIEQALEVLSMDTLQRGPRVGLALALPPERPGRPAALVPALLAAIAARYPDQFVEIRTFESGHAASYLALEAAMTGLAAAAVDVCLVAGVDTYFVPETLEWLEAVDQLHGAGRLNNAWGFVPGEGAGAVLIGLERLAHELGGPSYGTITGLGIARETRLIKTAAVCTGDGLTEAFRAALVGLEPGARVHNVFCDLNGDPYRADEYAFSVLRTKEHFRAASDFVAPADCWGDVGAASGPLHIALAVISHRKRYSKGDVSLAWASSDGGERGAALIRAAEAQER